MKKILIGLLALAVAALLVYAAIFIFINTKGEEIFTRAIRDNLGIEASVDTFSLKFPLTVKISGFKSEGISFKDCSISLGLFNPFTRNFNLGWVSFDGLELTMEKDQHSVYLVPFSLPAIPKTVRKSGSPPEERTAGPMPAPAAVSVPKAPDRQISFTIRDLELKDSTIEMVIRDRRTVNIIFGNVYLRMADFNYPRLSRFYLHLSSELFSATELTVSAGLLNVGGWVDYPRRAMDVDLSVDNFDYRAFDVYFPLFWKADNLGVKEAVLSLKSKLNSRNNALTIDCSLFLEEVEFVKKEETDDNTYSRAKTLKTTLALFRGKNDKPTLRFKLKTKMDSPQLDFSAVKDNFDTVFQISPFTLIEEVSGKAKEHLIDKVEQTGEFAVDTVIDTLKDAVEVLGDAFKINVPDSSDEQ